MLPWAREIDSLAERAVFAGVVAVVRGGHTEFAKAYGLADRANKVPNTVGTLFGLASGTKGLTALAVASLISDDALSLSTTARSVRDGGIYSSAADISALWQSLFANRIVPARWVTEMVRPRSDVPSQRMRYGLGFWLHRHTSTVLLEGMDAGVSFRSVHDPDSAVTHTVISNSSYGAWPITSRLGELLDD